MTTAGRVFISLLFLGVLVTGAIMLLHYGAYGWTLFVVIPFFIGGLAAWVFQPKTRAKAMEIGALASGLPTLSLLGFGLEGIICIAMSLPITIPLGGFGAWLFWPKSNQKSTGGVAMMMLLTPASLTWDVKAPPQLFEVRSSIEVAAPPERVWQNVVSFPDLAEPREWYFRTGIGYPQRTRITGSGVGATRYCDFSTGSFVEPVEIWDEPHLLQFRVTASAAPMREWSPYGEISPKHLHAYFVSKRGQFALTELPNHHTLVVGTSWYQHGLWPAEYWRWWSDAIIHRVHMRVLAHIKALSEAPLNGHS